jgi:hypothetical protein
MTKRTVAQTVKAFLSVLLVCLSLENIFYAHIGRWGSFAGAGAWLASLLFWIMGIAFFGSFLLGQVFKRNLYRWGAFFGGAFMCAVAYHIASKIGSVREEQLCAQEISKAVDAGLKNDCMKLLSAWPVKDESIDPSTPAFSRLPVSVRMLAPVYVENEPLDSAGLPPNIGICKNGWGGFAYGVRVFRNDEDATNFAVHTIGGYRRVAPGVYYWWHPT